MLSCTFLSSGKRTGVLGALLWFPELKDMDQYLTPARITQKYKLHVLPHIPRQSGDLDPQYSLQQKSSNAGIRSFASVVSYPTIKPPVLILRQLWPIWSGLNIKLAAGGGSQLMHHLGWTPPGPYQAGMCGISPATSAFHSDKRLGTVKVLSKAKRHPATWKTALGAFWNDILQANWQNIGPEKTLSNAEAIVVIQRFTVPGITDNRYDMPVLIKDKTVLVKPEHFEFAAALREVGPEKRAQAVVKGQATKARNKQEREEKAAGAESGLRRW
ncbi:hypothetical protein B0H13DRAFT_1879196 [Mycena leptocephala]|nr:hypothetical protein B0H13DRAFT_1879196 [Mycena leptocephala]